MPIPLVNLDNRTFDDLVKELQSLIPRYCPEWTDHNASDPGIMLLELFAWVTESLLYRMNRIPRDNEMELLRLLGYKGNGSLEEGRAATIEDLRGRWRAVTAEDFEELVLAQFDSVVRARCLADVAIDPEVPDFLTEKTGHVSVIIVPRRKEGERKSFPEPSLIREVLSFLDSRRLITCRLHVAGPVYTDIAVRSSVVCIAGPKPDDVEKNILTRLERFFAPVDGEVIGNAGGWPFGRKVYESEVCAKIEETPGVDHIESVMLLRKVGEDWIEGDGEITIAPQSLLCLDVLKTEESISVVSR